MDFSNLYSTLIMGVVVGISTGIPILVFGLIRKQVGLAVVGFFTTFIASLLLGIWLGLPSCLLFLALIANKKQA